MMKSEFTGRLGSDISDEDYNLIEYVYTYHPSISETEGKDQVVALYKIFGMAIFKDMLPRAKACADVECRIFFIKSLLSDTLDEYDHLKTCSLQEFPEEDEELPFY